MFVKFITEYKGIVVPSVFLERHQKLGGANKALTGVIETASIHDRIGILNSSSATFVILPGIPYFDCLLFFVRFYWYS